MNPDYTPWKILSATAYAGVLTNGWNLADPPESPESCRQFTLSVPFASPFAAPPVVHAGLSGFDLDQGSSSRLSVAVTSIDASGFDIVLTTWRDSLVYSAEISWLAVGP
jgi:hypothetical protein